jgi:S1-C subfamily serine protease
VGGYPLRTAMEDELGMAGRSPSFTKGVVGAVRLHRGHVVSQFDAPLAGGYSGGLVFKADTGEVTGLVTGQIVGEHGTTGSCFAVGINSAKSPLVGSSISASMA